MPTVVGEFILLILIVGLLVLVVFAIRRRPPQTTPLPVDPPKEHPPPLKLLGLDVWAPNIAPWFDPTRWRPLSFPAGSVICVAPTFTGGGQSSVRPMRFEFKVFATQAAAGWRIIEHGILLPEDRPFRWVWSGESFRTGGCGDTTPDPYRLVCIMHATNGSIQEVEVTVYAVSQRSCQAG